jgi:cytochrome c oxidase subunit 2
MNLPHTLAAASRTLFLPPQASNLAKDVDWAWNIILMTTTIFFLIVVFAMTFFVIRYRRRSHADETSTITHNTPLEIVWTIIPLLLVIGFFFVGFKGYINFDNPRSDAVVIDVEARKWGFTFTYPNGAVSDALYVQKDVPVRLNLHSIDVLHALYIPAFRIQRNLIPYRQTALWFVPTTYSPQPTKADPGGFTAFCTQYCGDGHSKMYTRVFVLDKATFDERMKELANPFKEKQGDKNVFVQYKDLGNKLYHQMGCATCHTLDGKPATGPTWQGLWKRDHAFSATTPPGYTLSAGDDDAKWEEYLSESITNPGAKIVANYPNGMPSFAAQLSGGTPDATGFRPNEEKRRALVEFIKSLNPSYKPVASREANPELFDADKPNAVHPESLAARKGQPAANQ